jgi:hypothetical protein
MSDLPLGHGFGQRPKHTGRKMPDSPRQRRAPRAARKRAPAGTGQATPAPSLVQVTHDNAPQVQAVLIQQVRDWLIRDHHLLREAVYYLRCIAENRAPTDKEAREAIEAPPEKLP